jgi:hypothetical protein
MLASVKVIFSGNLNTNNYLPYLKFIWSECSKEDKSSIFKAIIYLRSPRIGLGLEKKGISAMKALISVDHIFVSRNLQTYVEYCSWKDLTYFLPTIICGDIIRIWGDQLNIDIDNTYPSLCAKWVPSEGSADDNNYRVTARLCCYMGISKKELRKKYLTPFRRKLCIPETHISNKEYSLVEYGFLPKRARCKYHKLFLANDKDRYLEYLSTCTWEGLPSCNWDKRFVPQKIDTFEDRDIIGNVEGRGNILLVIDTSVNVSNVIQDIIKTIVVCISQTHCVYLSSFTEDAEYVKLENEKDIPMIISSFRSSLTFTLMYRETESMKFDKVYVLTTPLTFKPKDPGEVIWWEIHYLPPNFVINNNTTYIKGYSEGLLTYLINNSTTFNHDGYIDYTLSDPGLQVF